MWKIFLDEYDIKLCMFVAQQRDKFAKDRGFKPYNQDQLSTAQDNLYGAARECAAGKLLKIYWHHNIGITQDYDLFPDLQVRGTEHPRGRLLVRQRDKDTDRFIFVTRVAREFELRGWIFGGEAKKEEWWADPTKKNRFAYFVPHDALRPMETIKQDGVLRL